MKRSPLFHLTLGLMVVIAAYWAGAIHRWETQRRALPKQLCSGIPSLKQSDFPAGHSCGKTAGLEYRGYIVKYKQGTKRSAIEALLARLKGEHINEYKYLPGLSFETVGASLSVEDVLRIYRADPNVEFVEPNYVYHQSDSWPNDPGFEQQWGHHNTGQPIQGRPGGKAGADISAIAAWNISTGSKDIVVGVVDSGIDYLHPDLAANMWVNENEIPDNRIDDDKNGVIDDVYGYNAITNSGDPMDDNNHGTHCAGIIGAVGDNGEGIVGVNWNVRIMALKFLSGHGGGSLNDALECINYGLEMKARGVNLRVLSNSWGGGGYSKALEEAIQRANDQGILFVAAAGNDETNTDKDPNYPSCYNVPNVISVAALNNNDDLAVFSNYGENTVHIGAPGVEVYSTIPNGQYAYYSGTSMAAPYVSGAAALVLSKTPDLKAADLKARLLDSAVPVKSLKGKIKTGGRLNANQALVE
ncbi:MAG TPA: S8 family serine peptidase [Acidobacteriota bacterium]|nr:S8 family serine peptidase [Acidobacteriota bacterium]HNC44667.1 S8 family serine peptidase [Acidobacteriota bacterium]HND19613.1 S8 family serine peptidase [Acidobacteriota bacterium]HNG93177.1 S8 family serine peptidase [Acidobacteriota bacterium]HNJ38892.1 S8 family serine peptidase [Acidobacteriota bacterium]